MISSTETNAKFAKLASVVLLICAGLFVGVVIFSVLIVLVVGPQNTGFWFGPSTFVGLAFCVITIVATLMLPKMVTAKKVESLRREHQRLYAGGDERSPAEGLASAYVTMTILRYAVIELGIFANVICFYFEKSTWSLVAVGVGLMLMLATFPFPGRMVVWVDNHLGSFTGKIGDQER